MIEGYQAKDMHNYDETGLLYSALSTKSFAKTGSECHRGKNSKQNVFHEHLGCSLEKPLVAEKYKKLWYFKNGNIACDLEVLEKILDINCLNGWMADRMQ